LCLLMGTLNFILKYNVMKNLFYFVALLLTFKSYSQYNQFLDPEFSGDGFIVDNQYTYNSYFSDFALTDNGSIVKVDNIDGSRYVIKKYKNDGTLDVDFGENGMVLGPDAIANSFFKCMILDKEQRILVCGLRTVIYSNRVFVDRYLPDGTLDETFGDGGYAHVPGPEFCLQDAGDIIVDAQSRILITGRWDSGVESDIQLTDCMIWCLDNNGNPDPSFSDDGVLNFHGDGQWGTSLALLNNGDIVLLSGYIKYPELTENRSSLVRLIHSDGTISENFGNVLELNAFNPFPEYVNLVHSQPQKIAVNSDNQIYFLSSYAGSNCGFNSLQTILFGLTIDGDVLENISNGIDMSYFNGASHALADFEFAPDNKIAFISTTNLAYPTWPVMEQLTEQQSYLGIIDLNGNLQTQLFGNGLAIDDLVADQKEVFQCLKIQSDGKVICAGFSGFESILARHTILGTVAIEEDNSTQFKFYPNPVDEKVTIELSDGLNKNEISIFDSCGNLLEIKKTSLSNSITLDLSRYSKGIYFIKIDNLVRKIEII
jgi:uncharacterized delta-60 repeat protein